MWYEDFQDGYHGGNLGYENGTILAILNLHAASMPTTKFWLHPTYCSGADNNWRLSKWLPWQPSWIRFWWKVTDGQTDEGQTMVNRPWHKLTWSKAPGELTIEDLHLGCILDMFLTILNLHVAPMPPTKFWLNLTYHSEADEVWRFSRWPPWRAISNIGPKLF